ncbi:MAG: oligosaccharide flippase family protein [Phycisphaerales bacterium]
MPEPSDTHPPDRPRPEQRPQDAAPESLSRTVGGGMLWVAGTQFIGKILAVIAQIVVGWLLLPEDLALFATAFAVANLFSVVRDGGASGLLIQRGESHYHELVAPVFWMAATLASASALIIVALAWPLAHFFYHEPKLVGLLLVLACMFPAHVPAATLLVRLKMSFRFRLYGQITLACSAIRQLLIIGLAYAFTHSEATRPWASMALAIPAVVTLAIESFIYMAVVRERPWTRPPETRRWPELWRDGKWIVASNLAAAGMDNGPFLLLGAIMLKDQTGYFAFAFMVVAQLAVLLGYALEQVLFPAFARIKAEPLRQRGAALRALRAMMLVGSFACVGLAVGFEPLERLVWHGKWEPAVLAVAILALAYPWRITMALTNGLLQGRGEFKPQAIASLIEAAGLIVATGLGAWIHASATGAAIWTAGYLVLSRTVIMLWATRRLRTTIGELLSASLPAWILALCAGALAWGVSSRIDLGSIAAIPAGLAKHVEIVENLTRLLVASLVFVVCFAILVRLILRAHLEETFDILPQSLATRARSLLLLRGWPKPSFDRVPAALETLVIVLLAIWAIGRALSDRWLWSQWLSWIPSIAVVVPAFVLLAVAQIVRILTRWKARGTRRRSSRAAIIARLSFLVAVVWFARHDVGWSTLPATRQAGSFRVVHWNSSRPATKGWEERLATLDADIYIVQPGWGWNFSTFRAALDPAASLLQTHNHVVVSRFPINAWTSFSLELKPGEGIDPRLPDLKQIRLDTGMLIAALVRLPTGEQRLLWVIDLPSDLSLSRERVLAQTVAMIARFRAGELKVRVSDPSGRPVTDELLAALKGEPDLLIGDFNTPRGSRSLRHMTEGLRDTFTDNGRGWSATFPRRRPLWAIDQAYVGPGLRALDSRVVDLGLGSHRAIVVTLQPVISAPLRDADGSKPGEFTPPADQKPVE